MNRHPNLNNLKPYKPGEHRAITNGRKGGIKSGEVRRKKVEKQREYAIFKQEQDYINTLSNKEFESHINQIRNKYKDQFSNIESLLIEYREYFRPQSLPKSYQHYLANYYTSLGSALKRKYTFKDKEYWNIKRNFYHG